MKQFFESGFKSLFVCVCCLYMASLRCWPLSFFYVILGKIFSAEKKRTIDINHEINSVCFKQFFVRSNFFRRIVISRCFNTSVMLWSEKRMWNATKKKKAFWRDVFESFFFTLFKVLFLKRDFIHERNTKDNYYQRKSYNLDQMANHFFFCCSFLKRQKCRFKNFKNEKFFLFSMRSVWIFVVVLLPQLWFFPFSLHCYQLFDCFWCFFLSFFWFHCPFVCDFLHFHRIFSPFFFVWKTSYQFIPLRYLLYLFVSKRKIGMAVDPFHVWFRLQYCFCSSMQFHCIFFVLLLSVWRFEFAMGNSTNYGRTPWTNQNTVGLARHWWWKFFFSLVVFERAGWDFETFRIKTRMSKMRKRIYQIIITV